LTLEIETFDGENWKCTKCGSKFNLLQANDFRCPECNRQVKAKEIREKPLESICSFQILIIDPDYRGLGCQLTTRAWGWGGITGLSEIIYSPCNISLCPMYQTWKLLEQQQS